MGCFAFSSIRYPVKHVYVCNPAEKEYVQIEWPKGGDRDQKLASAFDPFCHPVDELSNLKIVSVSKEEYRRFLFQVYSSKTKEWRVLGIFQCDYDCDRLRCGLSQVVFVAGVVRVGETFLLPLMWKQSRSTLLSYLFGGGGDIHLRAFMKFPLGSLKTVFILF
ncbi:hypothetical protein IFM89_007016 [Coptis chinensis]|uniref:F-box protein n=1 Tax=Coptis chinensis TaxID=261450 RepID=A0A835IK71_9MAGN|nr:hypothetical protein IFM89_007016 [Coptis chinensis]